MSRRRNKDIHRSKELDKYLGHFVIITFYDNRIEKGVLEYGIPLGSGMGNSRKYSLNRTHFFRKTHIKKVEHYGCFYA